LYFALSLSSVAASAMPPKKHSIDAPDEDTKLAMMHKSQYVRHAAHFWCCDETWAANKWLDVQTVTPKDKWDYHGPSDSALRLPMPID
jgi:hypothetical protein